MLQRIRTSIRRDRGASAVEYGLLIAAVAIPVPLGAARLPVGPWAVAPTLAAVTLLSTLAPMVASAAPSKPAVTASKATKAPKVKKARTPEKSYAEQKAENGVYTRGTNWLSARFGWSKRAGEINGDGLIGYGLQYQRMLNNRDAFVVGVDRDRKSTRLNSSHRT